MRDLGLETIASVVLARVEATEVARGSSPPLVVVAETERHDDEVRPVTGSLLLLYTDGLVERRGELIDVGLERLRRCASRAPVTDVEAFLDHLLDELSDEHLEDDVALLAVRFAGVRG